MKYLTLTVLSIFVCVFFVEVGFLHASSVIPPADAASVAAVVDDTVSDKAQLYEPGSFEDPKVCSTCHRDIYNEWSKSMHANAWTDKWYRPDYLLAHQQTDGATDLLCGACHAPIAARTGLLPPADGSKFDDASRRGISCDFCHTVSGVGEMEL